MELKTGSAVFSLELSEIISDEINSTANLKITPYNNNGTVEDEIVCFSITNNTPDIESQTLLSEIKSSIEKFVLARGL